MRRFSKRAQLEPIMASLAARATSSTGLNLRPDPRRRTGSERAWKRFIEGDVAFRLPADLMERLDEYAGRVGANAPKHRLSASEIAQLMLSWVLYHIQREPTSETARDLAAALKREASRLDYHLDVICDVLDVLERFDARILGQELAEVKQLYDDLDILTQAADPKLPPR